ncbi:methyltransferase domain-containing protein [Nitratireductor mangrovi]|uniref:Methyltransferase domain-containing protein n=1 Tax=Nitratireductor mangrovi TaxID=2599600 RepID=A0A5B8L1X4_9HYPH|nr:methyltransferase domain-containing protein [Nitratireductor mangrovi]QDZ01518.1 methyltransferase domain-containing protein [Nitratireductor mangrovi]
MEPVFDPQTALARKKRLLAGSRPVAAFLMERAAEDLADRLATVERRFAAAAAIHCLTPHAALALRGSGKTDNVVRVEPDKAFLDGGAGFVSDNEVLPLELQSIDLAASLLTMHEVNDLPGWLIQIRRALRPDGLFLGAMAGGGTLEELRQSLLAAETEVTGGASPRVFPFADVRDAGGLLQRAGFALPVADADSVTVRYDTMFDLMRDLREMGATNTLVGRLRRPTARAVFLRAAQIYAERYADSDGRIRATFSFIWLSGWAPHPSQQQPLKPGSATMRLEDALKKGG